MNPQRWQQIDQLFHAALEREPDRRPAFLSQSCQGDEVLRDEVVSLIESHEQDAFFMEGSASDVAAELLARDPRNLQVGQNIGRYTILSSIGEGGMGRVYLAQDTQLERQVALKLLPAEFTIDVERVRRFEQEARAASALNHPNIVTIYEIGHSNSLHFIATEFIDGETLRQRLTNKRLNLDEALDIASQVANALSAAHEAGIVHRDIKPENIMLRRDGFVKVLDFGIAKLTFQQEETLAPSSKPSVVKTNPGIVMGTVRYMSPEQARGLEIDARTDVWSLGVVFYEMITRRMPFEGETRSHVIVSILESEPPPLSRSVEVPAELERIVTTALSKNISNRYQTAYDLSRDLKSLKRDLEVEASLKLSPRSEKSRNLAARPSKEPVCLTKTNLDGSTSGPAIGVTGLQSHGSGDLELKTAPQSPWYSSAKDWSFGLAIVLLAGLIGFALRFTSKPTAAPIEQPSSRSTAASILVPERTLTYWLLVQRPHEQQPFESIGNGVFDSGSKFWFNIQTPHTGALYLFSYGRNDSSVYEWNTMFPTPANNNGNAWLDTNHANPLRTKTAYLLQGSSGVIELWIVWAQDRISLLDEITSQSYTTQGSVNESTHQTKLQTFLEQNKTPQPEISVDKENARVTLTGRRAVLVDRRELEYRPAGGGVK